MSRKHFFQIVFTAYDSMTFDVEAASRKEAAKMAVKIRQTINEDRPVEWEMELIRKGPYS